MESQTIAFKFELNLTKDVAWDRTNARKFDVRAYTNFRLGNISTFGRMSTNSKSGSNFYYSYDMEYVVKTTSESEATFLLGILPEYYEVLNSDDCQHLKNNRGTFLPLYYGFYQITSDKDTFDFVVMKNVFRTGLQEQ